MIEFYVKKIEEEKRPCTEWDSNPQVLMTSHVVKLRPFGYGAVSMEPTILGCSGARSPAPNGIQTHDLLITRHVLYCWAETVARKFQAVPAAGSTSPRTSPPIRNRRNRTESKASSISGLGTGTRVALAAATTARPKVRISRPYFYCVSWKQSEQFIWNEEY